MEENDIITKFRELVRGYALAHMDITDSFGASRFLLSDVYVVWQVKVLQNWKALISTNLLDGMYYELTYNGDKNEIYLDAYKKFENVVYPFPPSEPQDITPKREEFTKPPFDFNVLPPGDTVPAWVPGDRREEEKEGF